MFKNIIWDITGKFGGQIISFIISVVLTRLLSPEEYGIMGMAIVVIGFASVFLDLGFKNALIQKQDVSQVQYSSVFYTNGLIGLVLCIACFLLAAPLSVFYKQPRLTAVFQVLSLNFLIGGLGLVPGAILYKKLVFKANTLISLSAGIVSGIVGIVLAYQGFGVWSLICQSLISNVLTLVVMFIYVKWWPSLKFSFRELKPLWSYGSRLFAASILETIFTRVDVFLVGKIFSPAKLGFYGRAQGMDSLVRQFSANSLLGVLFPYIVKNQHDRPALKDIFLRFLHYSLFISIGLSGGLYLTAKPLFNILFTSRWAYSAELFQILAVGGFAWPVSSLMCSIISGVGNSKAFLRAEIYKKLVFLPLYIFGFWLGLKPFVWSLMFGYYISVIINAYYVSIELKISVFCQCKIISKYLIAGIMSFIPVYILQLYDGIQYDYLKLIIYSATFIFLYVFFIWVGRLRGFELFHLALKKFKRS